MANTYTNPYLEDAMSLIRDVCKRGHKLRKEAGIPVRQPLNRMDVFLPEEDIDLLEKYQMAEEYLEEYAETQKKEK